MEICPLIQAEELKNLDLDLNDYSSVLEPKCRWLYGRVIIEMEVLKK